MAEDLLGPDSSPDAGVSLWGRTWEDKALETEIEPELNQFTYSVYQIIELLGVENRSSLVDLLTARTRFGALAMIKDEPNLSREVVKFMNIKERMWLRGIIDPDALACDLLAQEHPDLTLHGSVLEACRGIGANDLSVDHSHAQLPLFTNLAS